MLVVESRPAVFEQPGAVHSEDDRLTTIKTVLNILNILSILNRH